MVEHLLDALGVEAVFPQLSVTVDFGAVFGTELVGICRVMNVVLRCSGQFVNGHPVVGGEVLEVLLASIPIHLVAKGTVGISCFVQDVVSAAKWPYSVLGGDCARGVIAAACRAVVSWHVPARMPCTARYFGMGRVCQVADEAA
ncbi:hypothetical protein D2E95_09190 [Mycobacteroides abscessus]|nr:hypothetical protein D2E95_09190 [Mycobacteroides abscessus]RIU52532.1 hypothetical protein D2F02_05840 [Mycobacteroides abscessus]